MNDLLSDNSRPVTRTLDLPLYQVDNVSNALIYQRYTSGTGKVLIVRISVSGTVITYEKAFDTWANRGTATYVAIDVV